MPSSVAAAAVSGALTAAVGSAVRNDPDGFDAALGRLTQVDLERVGGVAAAAIRSLLEESFPDGLDADDVRAVLLRCAPSASWFPEFEPDALLLVLSGALGLIDPDQQPAVGQALVTRHAVLVIADLARAGSDGPMDQLTDRIERHLASALAEIQRAETMEMP